MKEVQASSVRQIDDGEETADVRSLTSKDRESIDNLAKTVQELAEQVAGLKAENTELRQSQQTSKRPTSRRTSTACWGCRKEGHRRKECKTHPWPTTEPKKDSEAGNMVSP